MKLKYAVVYEQTPNNYCAYSPDVPGCMSTGKNWSIVQDMIREALTVHIEFMIEHGEAIPEPRMSIEDAMVFHARISAEPDPEFEEFEDAPPLSTTFAMIEIEITVPVKAETGSTVPQNA